MSNANHEYDINLQFDQGIPDKLYGNAEIIKQVLTVLFCFAVKLSAADTPTTCTVRFLRIQNCDATQEKLYLVGISIRIPKSECVSVETLAKIFANRTYGSEFYVEFKEELKAYDLGLFIVSYLAQQCDTNIKCLEAGKCAEIVLEIPFSLTSQSEQTDNAGCIDNKPNIYVRNNTSISIDKLDNKTKKSHSFLNVSPISGNPDNDFLLRPRSNAFCNNSNLLSNDDFTEYFI